MDRDEDVRNTQDPVNWRSLAERASVEKDPEKLVKLVLHLKAHWRSSNGPSQIGNLVNIDQENGIQTRNYPVRDNRVIDRGTTDHSFDLLRAHVRERSIWSLRRQRVQEVIITVMAMVLGSVLGWAVMK